MTDSVRIIARDVFGAPPDSNKRIKAEGLWTEWTHPVDIIEAKRPVDVPGVLKRVEQANNDSLYALGFISYEAGSAFDKRFRTNTPHATPPFAWFALFSEYSEYHPETDYMAQEVSWTPSEKRNTYCEKINRIKKYIAAGETYQVNYTFKLNTTDPIDSAALFHTLYKRQPTPYAMLIEAPEFDVISISPELFFSLNGNSITCEPMKGTCPRGPHPTIDATRGKELQASRKNRAENVMIVDMVRNDLSRIAEASTINVDELFAVSPWPTLWQMTSTVSATADAGIHDIFKELFPSASITGAPKLQTSSIIAELENEPRGIYTGAIGWSLPKRKAQFSVAIRTAVRDKTKGTIEYGIGSGIVWDSEANSEYDECLLKASLLNQRNERFSILETLRWDKDDGYRFLDGHLDRLTATAEFFGFTSDRTSVSEELIKHTKQFTSPQVRVRLLSDDAGNITLEDSELNLPANYDKPESAREYTARIDENRNPVDSPFLYHKTTNRRIYDDARARNPDVDEVLLINERDEAMEFSTGNLVIRKGVEWLTPTISSGLLPGVLRNHLINKGKLKEAVITLKEIKTADEIYFINSVRGWIRVELI